MKLNSLFNYNKVPKYSNSIKTDNAKKINFKEDSLEITASSLRNSRNYLECYNKKGISYPMNMNKAETVSNIDKGTAIGSTVYVNRQAFDKIAHETTFGEVRWDEMGVDDEKRWVVINGQRFECEHSPQEKALRKRLKNMTLLDIMNEIEKNKDKDYRKRSKDNNTKHHLGNIEALKSNKPVMNLLGKIFNETSTEKILQHLS